MKVKTSRFGEIELEPERLIHFPLGLLGFEHCHRFALIDSDQVAPLRWLQSIDEPGLSFLVVEPHMFFPHYQVALTPEDRQVVELAKDADAVLACLVVVPENPKDMTINLMGPLVMNSEKRLGKQAVLHDSGYSPRQRLIPDTSPTETPVLV